MEEKLRNDLFQHFNKQALIDMVGQNEDFISLLIKTYFDGFYKYLNNIRNAVLTNDQASLKLNAHSITGSSKSVCFEVMSELAFELENLNINECKKINDLVDEMENELEIIKDFLNEIS